MANRKQTKTTIETREDLEGVMGEYCAQVIEMDRLTAQMEIEIAEVRRRYEEPLAACKQTGDGLFDDLNAYAVLHPEIFGERRSIELLHGSVGFRTCPPKVVQMPGVKVEHSLASLRVRNLERFIRTKSEIDKDEVLGEAAAARESGNAELEEEQFARLLASVGLRIERTELFYADPKRENGGE